MNKDKKVLVISGPTGVGENTIIQEIRKKFPIFERLTTATTRDLRVGEKNEVDYYFMSNNQFLTEVESGNIPEYQNSRDKNVYYGTYLPDLEKKIKAGNNIVVSTDIVGTKFFKEKYNATTIFIMPDSMENLKKRHLHRTPDISEKELNERLEYARREIEEESDFYDFEVINKQDRLKEAVKDVVNIIKKEGYKLEK